MQKITSSELQRRIGAQLDAVQREPIVIASNGRDRAVLMSMEEYRRLKRRDREVLDVGKLTDDDLAAIRAAEHPDSVRDRLIEAALKSERRARAEAVIEHLQKAGKDIDMSTDELMRLTRGDE